MNILRWIGVVVLPIPATFVFSFIAVYVAKLLSFIVPFSDGNAFGTQAIAAASVIGLVHTLAPSHQKAASVTWSTILIVLYLLSLIVNWHDFSRPAVVVSIAQLLGFASAGYFSLKD